MKKQIFKQAAALSLAVAVMAPAASALSWKDGAPRQPSLHLCR